jgi:uncharacterized spore protein YtfJ
VDPQHVLVGAQEAMTPRRVFGDPIQLEGVTVLPVSAVGGGGGGGVKGADAGVGFGLQARPAGVFVVRDGDAKWRPALNLNRVILGGQLLAVVAILTTGFLLRSWLAHGRA